MRKPLRRAVLFSMAVLSAAACLAPPAARAQDANAGGSPTAPFSGTSVRHATAEVIGIEPAWNAVTLRAENGEIAEVEVDPGIGDVKRLALGDRIDITYRSALLLRLDAVPANGIRERIDSELTTPAVNGRTTSLHRAQVVATVVRIDAARHEVTLRGPTRTVTLQASSAGLLKHVKVGDSVRADYVESTAIQVTRDGVPLH